MEIEPSGKWSIIASNTGSSLPDGTNSSSDNEDLVEIQDSSRVATLKGKARTTPLSVTRTPPLLSREASIASNTARSSKGKRPHSAIIDLTLSSDDDEQASQESKRLSLMSPSSRFSNSLNTLGSVGSSPLPRSNTINFHLPKPPFSQPQGINHGFGR